MMYCSRERVRARLIHSFIRYKNEIIFVNDVFTDDGLLRVLNPVTGEYSDLEFDDPYLDVGAFSPGYVNFETEADYITRLPTRQFVQGMTGANTNSRRNITSTKNMLALVSAMKNCYPTFQSCLTWVSRGQKRSSAFSRSLAIFRHASGRIKLFRSDFEIGEVVSGEIVLKPFYEKVRHLVLEEMRDDSLETI